MKKGHEKITIAETARIGIVNRGEAAVRFLRAVKEFNKYYHTNLTTVAYYLDVEEEALFVKQADIACPLGGVPGFDKSKGSPYLNHDLMLEALCATGCQAVWVGWASKRLSRSDDSKETIGEAVTLTLEPFPPRAP